MNVSVTVKGPLFDKKIDETVKTAIIEEALLKFGDRMKRGGKGLGSRRNEVGTYVDIGALKLVAESTRGGKEHWPRTVGSTWQRKNVAIVRAMAGPVMRKVGTRIASELG